MILAIATKQKKKKLKAEHRWGPACRSVGANQSWVGVLTTGRPPLHCVWTTFAREQTEKHNFLLSTTTYPPTSHLICPYKSNLTNIQSLPDFMLMKHALGINARQQPPKRMLWETITNSQGLFLSDFNPVTWGGGPMQYGTGFTAD